jgi:hypothetical protein
VSGTGWKEQELIWSYADCAEARRLEGVGGEMKELNIDVMFGDAPCTVSLMIRQ